MGTPIKLTEGMILTSSSGMTWEVGTHGGELRWFTPRVHGGAPVQGISASRFTYLFDGQTISYNPVIAWNKFYKSIIQ